MAPMERRVGELENKCREHSNEIHMAREWIATASVHMEAIPTLKGDVKDIKDEIDKIVLNGLIDSLAIKQIERTLKWTLGIFTTMSIGIALAYIKTRM